MVRDKAEAEDIVQDVFVKIWNAKDKLTDLKTVDAYVFAIAYNRSVDFIRKASSRQKYATEIMKAQLIDDWQDELSGVEYKDLDRQVKGMVLNLPARQQQVYLLHKEHGFTHGEIAEQLGISKNTVENHMAKALKFLRAGLGTLTTLSSGISFLFLRF